MKNILLIIILLIIGFNIKAQNSQLFENTWYLHELIIDGQSNIPPSNQEITNVPLDFFDDNLTFSTQVCNTGSGMVEFDSSNPDLLFLDISVTLITCQEQTNDEFDVKYFNFFTLNEQNPFVYNITMENTIKTLEITGDDGNKTIYRNVLLAKDEFQKHTFNLYPNPVNKILNFTTAKNLDIFSMKIFDNTGRVILLPNNNEIKKGYVNTENLANGIYFISLKTYYGETQTLKFIKE